MPTPPLSDEKCQEAVDALAEHGSINAAAASIKPNGLNRATLEGRLREARRRGFVSLIPPKLVIKGQSILHNESGVQVARWDKTKLAGRDPEDAVQLPDPKKVTKVSTLYDQQGNVSLQWVAERPEDAAREALWTQFGEHLAKDIPARKPIPKPKGFSHKDLLAAYPIVDHHTGMSAWAKESGKNWDLKIAEQSLRQAADYLIAQCPPCDTCLIPFLGDFFHYDSYSSVTPAHKNLLDADGRMPKMVEIGWMLIEYIIMAALERHKHVRVIFEKGNHDEATAAIVTLFLKRLYRDEPRVSVDDSPAFWHYFEFGKVLLATNHGDKVKMEKQLGVMAHDMPEAWGRAVYRMVMTGHVHHERRQEFPGGWVESFGVLPPADAYAHRGGYRSIQQMHALVFHRDGYLASRHMFYPGMFDAKVAA